MTKKKEVAKETKVSAKVTTKKPNKKAVVKLETKKKPTLEKRVLSQEKINDGLWLEVDRIDATIYELAKGIVKSEEKIESISRKYLEKANGLNANLKYRMHRIEKDQDKLSDVVFMVKTLLLFVILWLAFLSF